jgi:hypothetical protein
METVSSAARRKMYVYLTVFILLCLFSLVADRVAPHDPELANLMAAKKAPGGLSDRRARPSVFPKKAPPGRPMCTRPARERAHAQLQHDVGIELAHVAAHLGRQSAVDVGALGRDLEGVTHSARDARLHVDEVL